MSVFMLILVGLQLVSSETITLAKTNLRATSRMHMENEVATAEPHVSPSVTMEATVEPNVSPSATMEAIAEPYVSPSATVKARAEPHVSPSATIEATTEPYVFPSAATEAMIETYMSPDAKIETTTKMNRYPTATADEATEQSKFPTALTTTAPITEHQDDHASLKRPKDVTIVTAKEAVATDPQTLKPFTITTALALTSDTLTSTGESHHSETSSTEVSMATDATLVSMSDSVTKEMSSGKDRFSFLKSTFSCYLPSNIINVIHD